MLSSVTSYHRPATVGEALRWARQRGERVAFLAGGAALLARRDDSITAVVDLGGLGLDYIRQGEDAMGAPHVAIGAMTTLQTLVESPLLASFAGGLLATAAHHTATRTVRNAATIGGSIAACGLTTDIVVALLALRAEVVCASGRLLAIADILANRFPTRTPRLYTEIRVPAECAGYAAAMQRVARVPSDQAIVNVAAVARMESGVCVDIRLAAGGVGDKPQHLHSAENMLRRTRPDEARLAEAAAASMQMVDPPSDILGSADYRRAMLGVLLRRAVQQCSTREGAR